MPPRQAKPTRQRWYGRKVDERGLGRAFGGVGDAWEQEYDNIKNRPLDNIKNRPEWPLVKALSIDVKALALLTVAIGCWNDFMVY